MSQPDVSVFAKNIHGKFNGKNLERSTSRPCSIKASQVEFTMKRILQKNGWICHRNLVASFGELFPYLSVVSDLAILMKGAAFSKISISQQLH